MPTSSPGAPASAPVAASAAVAPTLLDPVLATLEPCQGSLPEAVASASGAAVALALAVPTPEADDAQRTMLHTLGIDLAAVVLAHEPDGKPGAVTVVPQAPGGPVRRLLLVGTGRGTPRELRTAGAAAARSLGPAEVLVTAIAAGDPVASRAVAEGLLLGGYSLPRWGRRAERRTPPRIVLVGHQDSDLRAAVAACGATALARNLAAVPANIKTPAWLTAQARTVARHSGLKVRVWDEGGLRREGFGGLLAVGSGSASPPRLVQVAYTPEDGALETSENPTHVVLVGKGITFDTGGLNLKPRESMMLMKTDMSGAAVALAVLGQCRALGVGVRVTALLALAENAIGAASYRPSDLITAYGGRTVEIGNTDAEGRIVLADALAYADTRLDPDVLIDVATLTGAATTALGRTMAPVFGTDAALVDALVAAGERTGEPVWPLPLVEDYRPALDSPVADLGQIAATPMQAGAVMAALFLCEFVGSRRWAHLDIAGPGRAETDSPISVAGPTGFGARLLLDYLVTLDPSGTRGEVSASPRRASRRRRSTAR